MVEGLQYLEDQNMFVSNSEDATIELGRMLGGIFDSDW